jgi:hypothetical protein
VVAMREMVGVTHRAPPMRRARCSSPTGGRNDKRFYAMEAWEQKAHQARDPTAVGVDLHLCQDRSSRTRAGTHHRPASLPGNKRSWTSGCWPTSVE